MPDGVPNSLVEQPHVMEVRLSPWEGDLNLRGLERFEEAFRFLTTGATLALPKFMELSFMLTHVKINDKSLGPVEQIELGDTRQGLTCPVHLGHDLVAATTFRLDSSKDNELVEAERMVLLKNDDRVVMFRSIDLGNGSRIAVEVGGVPSLVDVVPVSTYLVAAGDIKRTATGLLSVDCPYCVARGQGCECVASLKRRSSPFSTSAVKELVRELSAYQILREVWVPAATGYGSVTWTHGGKSPQSVERAYFDMCFSSGKLSELRQSTGQAMFAALHGPCLSPVRSDSMKHGSKEAPGADARDVGHKNAKGVIWCRTCGREFSQKGHLNFHVKTVHNKVRSHPCDLCSHKFTTRYNLARHIRVMHAS